MSRSPKLEVYGEKAKSWHKCRYCGGHIHKGDIIIVIHTIGEWPSYYHIDCAGFFADQITDKAREAEEVKKGV